MTNTLKTAKKEICSFYEEDIFKPCLTKQLLNMFNFGVHGLYSTHFPSACHRAFLYPKVLLFIYSQTRSSVPVANKLMNSLMKKWLRLLIQ